MSYWIVSGRPSVVPTGPMTRRLPTGSMTRPGAGSRAPKSGVKLQPRWIPGPIAHVNPATRLDKRTLVVPKDYSLPTERGPVQLKRGRCLSLSAYVHLPSFTCIFLQDFGKLARQIAVSIKSSHFQHQFSQMGSLRVHKCFAEQA